MAEYTERWEPGQKAFSGDKIKRSENYRPDYPNLTCYWELYFGTTKVSANEVSGLTESFELIPYRQGEDLDGYQQIKKVSPKRSRLTIKWGVFTFGNNGTHIFHQWRDTRAVYNDHNSVDILVILNDEDRQPVMYWICRGWIPVEYQGPTLKADTSEIAMQTLIMTTKSIRSTYVYGSQMSAESIFHQYAEEKRSKTENRWFASSINEDA